MVVRGLVPRRERLDLFRGAGLLPAELVAGKGQHLEVGMPLVERLELLVVFGGEASVRSHVHQEEHLACVVGHVHRDA